MKITEVIEHYGSLRNAARAIGFHHQACIRWKRQKYIPYETQLLLEHHSKKKLLANHEEGKPPFLRGKHSASSIEVPKALLKRFKGESEQ